VIGDRLRGAGGKNAAQDGAGAAAELAGEVPSPCIGVCVLDPQTGWCQGCLRTIDEIAAWGALDAPTRRAIRNSLRARRGARGEGAKGEA
jgi:predicted Fe-S protein YdhL (DUF1289 family)